MKMIFKEIKPLHIQYWQVKPHNVGDKCKNYCRKEDCDMTPFMRMLCERPIIMKKIRKDNERDTIN